VVREALPKETLRNSFATEYVPEKILPLTSTVTVC
jgi:hypothetical protein